MTPEQSEQTKTVETVEGNDLVEIKALVEALSVDDLLKKSIRDEMDLAIEEFRVASQGRGKILVETPQKLYSLRDKYCEENKISEITGLNDIIKKFNFYMFKFADQILGREAQLRSDRQPVKTEQAENQTEI